MTKDKNAERLFREAPSLREADLIEINALFPSYLFRRRRTGEVWTSCCGQHVIVEKDSPVLLAEHYPEPKNAGALTAPMPKTAVQEAKCPVCGQLCKVKELGRTGERDNLAAYRNVVALRWHEGALWAVGYYACKKYGAEDLLTARPKCSPRYYYRFVPGLAEAADGETYGFGYKTFAGCVSTKHIFPEAFPAAGYHVVGMDEIALSPFRYCGYNMLKHNVGRFFALCTMYPRPVEMLMKAGLSEIVTDFIARGKRNCRVFDWNEPDPLKSFGLTTPELREFLSGPKDLNVLYAFRQMKKAGVPASFAALRELRNDLGSEWFQRTSTRLARHRVSVQRIQNYFTKFGRGRKDGKRKLSDAAERWCDYVDAAKVLGYDLKNEVFLLPKDLDKKHDEATKEAAAILDMRRNDADKQKERRRLGQLCRRYTYTDGTWLIRPPHGAAEIVAEGKALKHCVGGYADRHVNGRTTILFLRDKADPERPRVTIEMRGNEIVQIHGWDDERTKCKANPKRESPRKLYAEFLNGWIAWLGAGSKRDKKGRPVLPEKAQEVRTA